MAKHILAVDDDKSILDMLGRILELNGYSVTAAYSGAEARRELKNGVYDLVLLDIRLGDVEGTELIPEIRRRQPQCVIIMLTGYADVKNAVSSLNHGADAYLEKPAKPGEVLSVIAEKLREKEKSVLNSDDNVADYIEKRFQRLEAETSEEIEHIRKIDERGGGDKK